MTITYINPLGHLKEADLSVEQIAKLKVKGYVVFEPARPRISISDSVCVSCEG